MNIFFNILRITKVGIINAPPVIVYTEDIFESSINETEDSVQLTNETIL